MEQLTDVDIDILNALYFVEPFDHILEEVDAQENVVKDAMRGLIDKNLVTPMKYNEKKKDFERSFIYDADDMRAYHYLATKEGLQAHNNR